MSFTLQKEQQIPEINSQVKLFTHDKTGARLLERVRRKLQRRFGDAAQRLPVRHLILDTDPELINQLAKSEKVSNDAFNAALPLATVGAFGAMWLLGLTLNVFAFIGLIMLLGLVTKNAILLIDYTNVLVARGRPPMAAAQEAARTRFRPVLMTAVSTVLGITPIALGLGAGGEARMPLGVAVASGLLASTALTLVVIPVVYTLVDQARTALRRPRADDAGAAPA